MTMNRKRDKQNNVATLPATQIPPTFHSAYEYLAALVKEGATMRYGNPLPTEVVSRIDEELSVIKHLEAVNYFLFYHKMVKATKDELGIWIGPGRGSCAGSIVSYCLDITTIDPIKHGLLYERFFNQNRGCMPDIDLDMDWDDRKILYAVFNNYRPELAETKGRNIKSCRLLPQGIWREV